MNDTPQDPAPPAGPAAGATEPWRHLRRHTPARIAQGRSGVSATTRDLLDFALAHAQARDAIHQGLDTPALVDELAGCGWPNVQVLRSRARHRHEYLLRPDLGRRLDPDDALRLQQQAAQHPGPFDLALVLGDGLSPLGVAHHAPALLQAIAACLDPAWRVAPLVIVREARVAVADEVGALLGARLVAIILGERPGLSSPDSVGIYLTHDPHVGCTDAQRNCISNIRPAGQDVGTAARRLAWLVGAARAAGRTGVGLKDDSGLPLAAPAPAPGLPR